MALALTFYIFSSTAADVASCGGIWNTYISLLNKSKDDEKQHAPHVSHEAK